MLPRTTAASTKGSGAWPLEFEFRFDLLTETQCSRSLRATCKAIPFSLGLDCLRSCKDC